MVRANGLVYGGLAFTWVKTDKHGIPRGACGPRPSVVKPASELVIWAAKKKKRPLELYDETVRQVRFAPVTLHSQKPSFVHQSIETMYPFATKCEMFARVDRPGWDCFGLNTNGGVVE